MNVSADTTILIPPLMEAELAQPMDAAADAACEALGLPLLGGPSGRGWSYHSVAQSCPHLFRETYGANGEGSGKERTHPAPELQIGGLFHLLMALYYGYGLGDGEAFYYKRGLLAPSLVERLGKRGRKTPKDWIKLPNDAADQILARLRAEADPERLAVDKPSMSILLEAERIFDAHTNFYGGGQEDTIPLAVEWFAEHPLLGYTCRYDMIVRLGEDDPFVRAGHFEAGAVCVIEHKSARWLSEWARENWFLDGEILGQALLWKASGCEHLFGPLAGILVDIVTKEKVPKFERVLVPPNPITTAAFEQSIRWQHGEIALWRAANYFPRRLTACWRFGKPCGLLQKCRADAASESLALVQGSEEMVDVP